MFEFSFNLTPCQAKQNANRSAKSRTNGGAGATVRNDREKQPRRMD